ncbi:MAG: peptidoglycan DD-metalloendopeptidase family protein [Bacteroidales bacterium]|nr:peptidoglycan DD-metalloendopeptidase family protein [Bacteroidales bacterium]
MTVFNPSKIALSILLAGLTFVGASAQFKLPGAHTAEHRTLIASQEKIGTEIQNTTTQEFLDKLFAEEEEPEMDIYTEGWESQSVNCYRGVTVPQQRVLDVSNFAMPCNGYVTSPYGYRPRFKRMHKGIDLKATTGDTIYAAFDGKVRLAKYEKKGYGYYLVLRHPNELETVYGHLSKFLVKPDQVVKAGQPIALAGNTGRSFGAHLHFETRFMGYAINPAAIFDFANQTTHTVSYTFNKNTYQEARNFDPEANNEYAAKYKAQRAAQSSASKATKAAKKSSGTRTHKEKKGETLAKIAGRNGMTIKELCALNGLKTSSKLRIGQTLKLK